ncbi:hypothetical protein [Aromatoleum evansii]|uniref:hypothetical protein n=1 Tax=Aromatoleum evansii TaxID=59406 RepID=UPI00145C88D8|nr:hypothetical protein [Aromatoleum evansii]NMG29353.1 hypothetical protein [Aromatoleum evansii]
MENTMDLEPAAAAKLVGREVPVLDKEGKATGKTERKPIAAAEVFACRVRDTAVTVITTSGEKLTGNLPVKAEK